MTERHLHASSSRTTEVGQRHSALSVQRKHTGQGDEALEKLEIRLLLEGVFQQYGFDFREYALHSLKRRIWKGVHTERLGSISGLQERVLHDPAAWERLLLALSVNVTAMFRNPEFFLSFRRNVVPTLAEQPFIRVWHAGCATGEEVYSTAIVLAEEGVLHKARIYATDMNESVLAKARAGIYPLERIRGSNEDYESAGGTGLFSRHYTAKYDNAIFRSSLKQHIVFSRHNLATDRDFNRFDVIFCRNVMIYFNESLQDRVHRLLYRSLTDHGVLGLGHRESIRYTPHEADYTAIDPMQRLYRRVR